MKPVYINDRLKQMESVPPHFKLHHPGNSGEVRFDFERHVQIELPQTVKTLDFKTVQYPYTPEVKRAFPGLAYTQPFRLLSDEGVQALRNVIDMHKDQYLKYNGRNNSLRGLGFLSQFVRDLASSEEISQAFSDLAQEPLGPNNLTMNTCHTNFGIPGDGRAVDQWHVDSVDYVSVLIVSDMTDMEGGELQVLQLSDSSGKEFDRLRLQGIPSHLVENVNYKRAGYCIFCQGSKILHSVTPVLSAREPRISCVQSFTRLNVFAPDMLRYCTYKEISYDPLNVLNYEYAKHKAWRVNGQLKYLIEKLSIDADIEKLASILENAGNELLYAKDLLLSKRNDRAGFIVNEKDYLTKEGLDDGSQEATTVAASAPISGVLPQSDDTEGQVVKRARRA